MELKKDLLEIERKSTYKIVIGIAFIAFSILWVTSRYIDNQPIRVYDWLYFGVFSLNGIINLLDGFGISVSRIFGNAFIRISKESIRFKLSIYEKEKCFFWNEIESIEFNPTHILIAETNSTQKVVGYSELDYKTVGKVKEAINHFAKELNINVIHH